MNQHVLKLRKTVRFALWRDLHSQACQNVCARIDDGYQRFFNKLAKRPPKFRKAKKYDSFTFPQSGYVVKIDRFTATTKTCSGCGQRHELTLRDRILNCDCGVSIDRDHNAAINIECVGASTRYQSDSKPPVRLRSCVDGRSPSL